MLCAIVRLRASRLGNKDGFFMMTSLPPVLLAQADGDIAGDFKENCLEAAWIRGKVVRAVVGKRAAGLLGNIA